MCKRIKRLARRMLVFFRDMRIAWKFTLAYFVILALPMILIGIYISRTTTEAIIHQAGLLARQSLLQEREQINRKIGDVERTALAITQHPQVLGFLDAPFLNNRIGYENYNYFFAPLFESQLVQNKYVFHTLLYIRNRSFPDAWNGIHHLTHADEDPYLRELLAGEALSKWHPVHDSKLERSVTLPERTKVFSYSRKLISFADKTCIGVMELELTVRELFDGLEQEKETGARFLVVDASGAVVHDSAFTGEAPNLKALALARTKEMPEQNAVVVDGREEYVVSSVPLDPLGYRLVGVTSLSMYMGTRAGYKGVILMVLLAGLVVFAGLIHFVSNHLTRRMGVLLEGMRSIRDGNINIQMKIGSHDELGELAHSFNLMTERMHDLIERVYKAQITEKESALKALEAQINPHFLYNSLSTLSWMARKIHADNIDNLSFLISKFYRLVLSKGNSIIPVQDEIELLKAYVGIEQIRFDDLFHVVYDLDETAYGHRMAKILLQPIAENAINHGIAPKGSVGTMIVRLRQDETSLRFTIIDDGVGMDESTLESINRGDVLKRRESGYAIRNVRERIQAIYGDKGRVVLFSRPGIGCAVEITIPKNPEFLNF